MNEELLADDALCEWCGHRRDAHRPGCEWGFGEPDRCDCHAFDHVGEVQ